MKQNKQREYPSAVKQQDGYAFVYPGNSAGKGCSGPKKCIGCNNANPSDREIPNGTDAGEIDDISKKNNDRKSSTGRDLL